MDLHLATGLPMISLDTVYWRPGWKECPPDEMREIVADFLAKNKNWIIDGNYMRKIGNLTWDSATDIICKRLRIILGVIDSNTVWALRAGPSFLALLPSSVPSNNPSILEIGGDLRERLL